MRAKEYLNYGDCPNLKVGFDLDDIQFSVLCVTMEAYAKHEMINFLDDLRNYLHESHNDLLKDERTSKEFVEIYLNP